MSTSPLSGDLKSAAALTIAGFDPSSGAGVSADLLVFAAHGIFGTAAITALTVQSTQGVRTVQATGPELLRDTLRCLEEDLPPDAIKIGMLASAEHVHTTADYIRQVRLQRSLQVVLDPVLRSSSGAVLLDVGGVDALKRELLPVVDAITPNLPEAEVLSGLPCRSPVEMEACAKELQSRYPHLRVVITGGHLANPQDFVLADGEARWLTGERIPTRATHGTGCAFSTALLAQRMQGTGWPEAAARAKAYVANAMATAVARGHGHGPMNLFGAQQAASSVKRAGR